MTILVLEAERPAVLFVSEFLAESMQPADKQHRKHVLPMSVAEYIMHTAT